MIPKYANWLFSRSDCDDSRIDGRSNGVRRYQNKLFQTEATASELGNRFPHFAKLI